jgi:tellurite resistance protein TerC
MAVMGLRSLYFLLIGMLTRLRFLHHGLAAVLAFAAFKMLASRWIDIGPAASLLIILGLLAITVCASLWAPASRRS